LSARTYSMLFVSPILIHLASSVVKLPLFVYTSQLISPHPSLKKGDLGKDGAGDIKGATFLVLSSEEGVAGLGAEW
jgi:hypothetical protein